MTQTLRAVRLAPSDPHSALRRCARAMPARQSGSRHLSSQQLKNPLLRSAYDRLRNIVNYRGRFLRRLDTVHGDRRTRLEKFLALAGISEQLLVRLDLATGVLGYIDEQNARFVVNTQRNIAEDSGVSAPVLCRLLKTMEAVGYVYRRVQRVRLDEKDESGLHLVRTRVLIRFTKLFWNDLGLRYVHERVQKAAKKRRKMLLRDLDQRRLANMERESLVQYRREVARKHWQSKEAGNTGRADASAASPQASVSQPSPALQRAAGNDVLKALNKLLLNKSKSSG